MDSKGFFAINFEQISTNNCAWSRVGGCSWPAHGIFTYPIFEFSTSDLL